MRVVRDQFAHINSRETGERLHTQVRILIDDTGRVAVFLSPTLGPHIVYEAASVNLIKVGGNCSHPVCHGKASRLSLTRLWEQAEPASV